MQTRGYRLPDYLSVNYRLRKGALNQGVLTVGLGNCETSSQS